MPATQLMHAASPVAILYLPATHRTHRPHCRGLVHPALQVQSVSSSLNVDPALHLQSVRSVLPRGEVECPGHASQTLDTFAPHTEEYVPSSQGWHGATYPENHIYLPGVHILHSTLPQSSAYQPGMHATHTARPSNPPVDVPCRQTRQVFSAWAPTPLEYLPAVQWAQALFPVWTLYFPAAHCTH